MRETLEKIKAEALEALSAPSANIEDLRIKYLGKKGELTAVLRGMGKLSAEERPVIGQLANDIRAEIEAKIEAYTPEICILDFQEVSFMDSSGIAVVINALRCMKRIDGRLELSGIQAQPMRVFQASGVDKIVQIQEVNV